MKMKIAKLPGDGIGPEVVEQAVKAAGYNQLRSLGITDRGEIVPGQIADIVLVDDNLNPKTTIVGGRV